MFHVERNTLNVVFYVDDMILSGNNYDIMFRLKHWLDDTFEMIVLGILHFFLGVQVLPVSHGIFVSQSKYVMDLLTCFKMDECKACDTPY